MFRKQKAVDVSGFIYLSTINPVSEDSWTKIFFKNTLYY